MVVQEGLKGAMGEVEEMVDQAEVMEEMGVMVELEEATGEMEELVVTIRQVWAEMEEMEAMVDQLEERKGAIVKIL